MADPTLRLTYTQLQTRVAEFLGIALLATSSAAAAPTDTHDLDLVKRLVNDGYRRFITENDRWNFLNVPFNLRFVEQSTGSITATGAGTFTVGALAGDFANDYFNGWQFGLVDEDTGDIYEVTIVDYVGATGA